MYDAHKIYDKKTIEYVIFEKEEKYKYIFSISDPYSNTLKKKKKIIWIKGSAWIQTNCSRSWTMKGKKKIRAECVKRTNRTRDIATGELWDTIKDIIDDMEKNKDNIRRLSRIEQ